MNERTRYEQSLAEQLSNLPLPDEDKSWLAMKKLLDEKDDDGAIIVPPPKRGCGLWGAALLLILVVGGLIYYFTRPESLDSSETVSEKATEKNKNVSPEIAINQIDTSGVSFESGTIIEDSLPGGKSMNSNLSRGDSGIVENKSATSSASITENDNSGSTRRRPATYSGRNSISITPGTAQSGNADRRRKSKNTNQESRVTIQPAEVDKTDEVSKHEITNPDAEVILDTFPPEIENNPDTNSKRFDSLQKEINKTDTSKMIEDSVIKKKKRFTLAVGIAQQHSFPINGTESVSNGLLGRKSNLADYIPSVYLRLYRENRWFFQSEFKYGAPQYVKGFAYRNIVEIDTFQTTTTRSFFLRKTFYHQVPLSFHYFILPGWSVGTGVVYNRFQGTISEESLRMRITGTTIDTLVESKVINHKQDSAFKRNTWQWMAETQYKWKRFSVGARYAQGLQPYIQYVDAQGIPQSKKHQSFNIFLRYELWRSKQK